MYNICYKAKNKVNSEQTNYLLLLQYFLIILAIT